MTAAAAKIIQAGRLTHADIAKRAGTSRTRVTAIANANTQGVSTDVHIRVLAATAAIAQNYESRRPRPKDHRMRQVREMFDCKT